MDLIDSSRRLYLQVPQLSELLATVIELASERLDLLMNDLMRSYVATLRKSLAALVAVVRSLSGMATLVSLRSLSAMGQASYVSSNIP